MPDAVPLRSALIRLKDADTDVEVDLRAGTVLRGGLRVRLPQHALDTLRILLTTPGDAVTWEVLRDRLWDHGTESEFEARVYDAIRRLREAFGDNDEHPRFVETVGGVGFRFLAPIQSARGLGSARASAPGSHGAAWPGSGTGAGSNGELPASDAGRYEVLERIGAGAMGEVYRARDLRLDREVAIKFLPEWMTADPLALHRFRREAYATASLNHPNVLAVHDLAVIDGSPCMVSELLVGQTLRTALATGPIQVPDAVAYAQQVLDGLVAAHGKGIIHRDLKPENLFLTGDGHLKILDFGLAKEIEQGDGSAVATTMTPTTRTGAVLGTLGYQSPEQARGEEVDVRTDLFAFGAVFYELLTGRRPFYRQTEADTIAAMLHEDPPPPSTVNPAVPASCDAIVAKALEKDRELRYQSAAEARADIRRVVRELGGGSSHSSQWSGPGSRIPAPPRRRRKTVVAWGVAVASVAAAAWLLASTAGNPVPAFTATRLTRGAGVEAQPVLSPDGHLVAYVSDESGNRDVWLFDVRSRSAHNLTAHPSSDVHPSWSGDGSSVFFQSDRDGHPSVWRTPVVGGTAVRVIDNAEDPAVSPDGQFLAFARPVGGFHRIFVLPLADVAGLRQLTKTGNGIWSHRKPAWSPDSSTICYMTNRQLWVVSAAGGPARKVVAQGDYDVDPSWSSDGRSLYYSSSRGGGESLWQLMIDPGLARRLLFWRAPTPQPVIGGTGPEQEPSVSVDGRRLVYSTWEEDTNLGVADLQANRVTPTWGTTQNESFPAIAPDGSRVYYVSRADPPYNQLWVQNLDHGQPAGEPQRLTNHVGFVSQPACSPDGRWVAYYLIETVGVGAGASERRSIWIIRADGGAPLRVADGPNDSQPAWSPKADALAFVRTARDLGRIFVVPLDANGRPGAASPVTRGVGDESTPSWGPGGIAFLRVGEKEAGLLVVTPDGRGERHIAVDGKPLRAAWDPVVPGALLVAVARGDEQMADLERVPAAPGVPAAPLPSAAPKNIRNGYFTVTRDGRLIAYMVTEQHGGDIWMLEAKGSGRF